MKNILFIFLIFLLSCEEHQTPKSTSISGKITNLNEGSKIYLDFLTPKQIITKDSTIIGENGDYSFSYQINTIGYYRLRINNQNFISLVFENGDKPIINGDGNNLMDTYTVEGSNESNRFKEFQNAYRINNWKQDSLNRLYQANKNDAGLFAELQKSNFNSIRDMNTVFINLINSNPSSLVSLYAVQQLDEKINDNLYKKVDYELGKTIPNNEWYADFHSKLANRVNLYVGEPAPDFTLNDVNDKPISLASLKGKIVLIDFWASWCRPCRAENPNVVKAYQKYHKKGFDVLSVSLDGMPQQQNAKQDWMDAIAKDGLLWKNHVSDLKGWKSKVVPIFNIEGIPFTILVDKEGKILGINLRGEELENKLAEIFK